MSERGCGVDGCEQRVYARGLCGRHYKQQLRHGGVRPDRVPVSCAVDSCDRRAVTRGWCRGHYLRWSRTGDVQADTPLGRSGRRCCAVPGCARAVHSHGLCEAHRQRLLLSGDVRAGTPLREPGVGRHLTHGYVRVAVDPSERWLVGGAGTAAEHRLVMARLLGRPLAPDESVHHRNGIRTDNRPENLELWRRYQPTGSRVVDQLAWAWEVIRRYAPEAALLLEPDASSETEQPGYET